MYTRTHTRAHARTYMHVFTCIYMHMHMDILSPCLHMDIRCVYDNGGYAVVEAMFMAGGSNCVWVLLRRQ